MTPADLPLVYSPGWSDQKPTGAVVCYTDMSREHVTPNTRSYNALLSACERAEQPDRALEVLLNMRRRAPAAWGYIDPNAVTFNTVMSATARAGRYAPCMP